jgi:hypothetical protein
LLLCKQIDKAASRPAFHGLLLGVVQSKAVAAAAGGAAAAAGSTGTVQVKVEAAGLQSDTLMISTKAAADGVLKLRL